MGDVKGERAVTFHGEVDALRESTDSSMMGDVKGERIVNGHGEENTHTAAWTGDLKGERILTGHGKVDTFREHSRLQQTSPLALLPRTHDKPHALNPCPSTPDARQTTHKRPTAHTKHTHNKPHTSSKERTKETHEARRWAG